MQQEKFVLPKFTVPGQRNWVKWALVGVGGLVAVNLMVFSVVLSKRTRSRSAVVASPTPPRTDQAPLSPAATPKPVQQPKAALAAATASPADEAPATDDASAKAPKAPSHHSHRSSHASSNHGSRSLAKATSGTQHATGKPDALDELLKR